MATIGPFRSPHPRSRLTLTLRLQPRTAKCEEGRRSVSRENESVPDFYIYRDRYKVSSPGIQQQRCTSVTLRTRKNEEKMQRSPPISPCFSMCRRPKVPLSPEEAISSHKAELTTLELAEIGGYEAVYYVGKGKSKTKEGRYDGRQGEFLVRVGDQIAYRYEVVRVMGKGTYGIVVSCKDHKTGEDVAVKVIKNSPLYHQQGLCEISILEHLRDKAANSIITLRASFLFRKHLCLVFDLLYCSLASKLKANKLHSLSVTHIKDYSLQLLTALKYLKDAQIIHADLKPDNILLDKKGHLKLIDFGCACYENTTAPGYAQSRYYRAPEVILETGLSCSADMWSLGCILVEMAKGTVTFPGDNEKQQLALQMELLGKPPKSVICRSAKKGLFFEANGTPKQVHSAQGRPIFPGSVSLSSYLPNSSKQFIDLVSRCLDWNPESRLTPTGALQHPWFQSSPHLPKSPPTELSTSQSQRSLPVRRLSIQL